MILLEINIEHDAAFLLIEPEQLTALKIGGRSNTAGQLQKIYQPCSRVELVNRGAFHRSADRGNRSERWNHNDIAGLQSGVMTAIAGHQELIEVNLGLRPGSPEPNESGAMTRIWQDRRLHTAHWKQSPGN